MSWNIGRKKGPANEEEDTAGKKEIKEVRNKKTKNEDNVTREEDDEHEPALTEISNKRE